MPAWIQKGKRGQSLVEFALTLPILALILAGLLDLGRLYFTYIALEDAATDAAIFLATYPGCQTPTSDPDSTTTGECANPNNAIWRALCAAPARNSAGVATVSYKGTTYDCGESGTGSATLRMVNWAAIEDTGQCGDEGFEGICSCVPSADIGVEVEVQISYPYELLTPLISNLAPDGITLRTTATQTIVSMRGGTAGITCRL